MQIIDSPSSAEWDAFLEAQEWSPFLQSFQMGEVYQSIGQTPIRLMAKDGLSSEASAKEDEKVVGICFGHVVDARRGKHIAIPYGPIVTSDEALTPLIDAMKRKAKKHGATFIRLSPWRKEGSSLPFSTVSSPLHLLAEHVWFIRLMENGKLKMEDDILAGMRKTTRNLIRRAKRDGVTVEASKNPMDDITHFQKLHEETRKRHGFTPYTDDFFRSQLSEFSKKGHATLYLARHEGRVIASSIHMHAFGETSYHHGASEQTKVPASYLLQWTAIQDAMKRGDTKYNFWGIAPQAPAPNPSPVRGGGAKGRGPKKHPFAGVTLFKTGFGGELLNLIHCQDVPVSPAYWKTYIIEHLRKWKRGF